MRAGIILGIVLLCACGQVHAPVVALDGGAGSGGTSDAGPADAGDPDAGADAGPADAGPAADCAGVVPRSVGPALTFDVPESAGKSCSAATSDGRGILAAEVHDGGAPGPDDPVRWAEFGQNGAWQGTFTGPYALYAQAAGFEGYSAGWVTLWDEGGSMANFTAVETGALVGPGFSGGVVSVGATATGIAVHRIDASGNETGSGSAAVSGAIAVSGGAEDQGGAIVALFQSAAATRFLWFDLTRKTSTSAADLGPAARDVLARPLAGGGVAVRLDGRWTALLMPGSTSVAAAPAWLSDGTDFALVRGGAAYALWPASGNAMSFVSTQGSACGALSFPGVASLALGADRTVIGASGPGGCAKLYWLGALK